LVQACNGPPRLVFADVVDAILTTDPGRGDARTRGPGDITVQGVADVHDTVGTQAEGAEGVVEDHRVGL